MSTIIYTSPTCPNCSMLKRILNERKIEYTELSYTELPNNVDIKTIPIIKYNDNYYDVHTFLKMLMEEIK